VDARVGKQGERRKGPGEGGVRGTASKAWGWGVRQSEQARRWDGEWDEEETTTRKRTRQRENSRAYSRVAAAGGPSRATAPGCRPPRGGPHGGFGGVPPAGLAGSSLQAAVADSTRVGAPPRHHSTLSNWVTENLKYMRTVRGRERNVFPCSKPRDTILANVAVSISKRLCLRRLSDTPRDLLTPPTWSPLPMCVLVYSQ